MTSTKTSKRALLTSVIALLLCCSMLVGTTYAWFTDSVTSGVNQIVAGNLDIELYYATPSDVDDSGNIPEDAWTKVTADAPVFNKNALWEPGYTEVVYLKTVNEGTLSLRYHMNVRIAEETPGVNKAGKVFNLSDYIQAYAIQAADYQFQPLTSRQMASDPLSLNIGAPDPFSDTLANATQGNYDGFETGVYDSMSLNLSQWLEPEEEWYTTLVLFMPTSVGNEANYMTGTTPPQINLGLNVLATQYNWDQEKDSFDHNYDEGLNPEYNYLFDGAQIHYSTNKSGYYVLSEDIITSDSDARYGYGYEYIVRNGADYTFDLNGKSITFDTINENANHNALTYLFVANHAGTQLTINGEGQVYANNSEGYTCAIQGKDGTLITVNGGDYQVENGIAVWAGAGAHIIINGGSFVNEKAKTDHELIYSSGGVIDIYGGFFHNKDGNYTLNVEDRNRATGFINVYGGTYVNFDPTTGGQDPNNIKVAEGYTVISTVKDNGDTWYTVVPVEYKNYSPAADVEDLTNLIEADKDVVIVDDIVTEEKTETLLYADTNINVDGNGATITTSGVGTAPGNADYGYVGFIPAHGEDATVSNIKVIGSGFVEVGHHGISTGGDYTITNLVIQDLVATLAVNNGGNNIAAAFSHYGNAVMKDCVMTGTTTLKDGFKPYDAAFVNGTKTLIDGGKYGTIYLANQAHVTITNAKINVIDSCAITTRNLGKLTIGAGAEIGTINLNPGSYPPALVIEDGATVGAIVYNGVTYTVAEWQAR